MNLLMWAHVSTFTAGLYMVSPLGRKAYFNVALILHGFVLLGLYHHLDLISKLYGIIAVLGWLMCWGMRGYRWVRWSVAMTLLYLSVHLIQFKPEWVLSQHILMGQCAVGLLCVGLMLNVGWAIQVYALKFKHALLDWVPALEQLERYCLMGLWLGWTGLTQTILTGWLLTEPSLSQTHGMILNISKHGLSSIMWCFLTLVLGLKSFGYLRQAWIVWGVTLFTCIVAIWAWMSGGV